MFEFSLILLLAWGALAFGAEYAWAYAPLLVFCLVPGIIGLRASRGALPSRALLIALFLIFLGGLAQIFLPAAAIPASLQPGAGSTDFRALYARMMLQPASDWQAGALSIAPTRTVIGLAFLAAFSLLLAGCTKGVSAYGPKRLVRGIIVLGLVVAFAGLIQRAVQSPKIYGLWTPLSPSTPFAPFFNENHFAGWMAMAVSLTIGAVAGHIARAFERVKPDWRERVLWFSSPEASVMILTAFATGVMALAMVVTYSRGGLVGLITIGAVGSGWMLRRQSGMRRAIGGLLLAVLVVVAAAWGGADKTIDQFSGASADYGGRESIWKDTLRIVEGYPVTGTGLNTYGIAMLRYQSSTHDVMFLEAHNDYLQLAAEGGLLLGLPILAAIGLLAREIWRRFRERADDVETYWLRAGAVTGLCAIAVMEAFDFTLQMPGAVALFVVLCAIAIHRPHHLDRSRVERQAQRRR